MEVGPFRTVPASKASSGEVELELVDGGWEEFGTVIFGEPCSPLLPQITNFRAHTGDDPHAVLQSINRPGRDTR